MRTIETDVVIIGAGGAGLPAASMAFENGVKRIVILEKRPTAGGNAVFADGLFACESPVQRRAMVDASKDEIYKKAVEWHHYDRINARVLRAYINKSGETIRWLQGKGVEFEVTTDAGLYWNQLPTWHVVTNGGPRSRFGDVMRKLLKECKANGAEVLLKTECTNILTGAHGEVTGVLAKNEDGEEYTIHAPCVIIATGGFMGRKDLLKKYFSYYEEGFFGFYVPHMGDGLTLAEEAGGALEEYCTLIKETCHSSDDIKEMFLTVVAREPVSIWVNKLGRRFIDETSGAHMQISANALISQPGKHGWSIWDDELVEEAMKNGFVLPRYPGRTVATNLREELQEVASRKEWVIKSDSWDEIAAWIGAPAKTLKATVEEYNSFFDHGYDESFVKDRRYLRPLRKPPFYAVKFGVMVVDTCGPIRVNEAMEVLDAEHHPIPGLFAGGVTVSGWQGHDYCGDLLFASALGFAVNSGRIAGESAAQWVLGSGAK